MLRVVAIVAVAAALVGAVAGSGLNRPGLYRLYPTSIEFSDATAGIASFSYACGQNGCLHAVGRTRDGGRTWKIERARAAGEWKPPIAFVTQRVAYTWEQTDTRSRLLRSDDAGRTWVEKRNPCARLLVLAVSFVSTARGWMLCRIGGHGTQGDQVQAVFETRDAAQKWHRIGGTPPVLYGIELVQGLPGPGAGSHGRMRSSCPPLASLPGGKFSVTPQDMAAGESRASMPSRLTSPTRSFDGMTYIDPSCGGRPIAAARGPLFTSGPLRGRTVGSSESRARQQQVPG